MFEEQIEVYTNTLRDMKDSILSSQVTGGYEDNYKQTLLFGLLDLMSKCRYRKMGNGDRFRSFILDFCNWPHANRISLLHLEFVANRDTSLELSRVRMFVLEKKGKWPKAKPVPLDEEPTLEEVIRLWPSGYKALGKITPQDICHVNLLWKLRNSLVHEMRRLGRGWALFQGNVPHYVPRLAGEINVNTRHLSLIQEWDLYYPTGFYKQLVEFGIDNLNAYLTDNDTNPYEAYSFDSSWIDL